MKWMEDEAWHRSIITKAVHPWIHIRVSILVEIPHNLFKKLDQWYFVTKIVLTYCEKNCSSDQEIFEIRG